MTAFQFSRTISDASQPLVSVVCINKNSRVWLAETIHSVLSQTIDDLELVVADGGSTDGSIELIGQYPAIRLVPGADKSRADGVMRAVRAARGKYIAFTTSSDGYASRTWLATAVKHLEGDPEAGLVWGASAYMTEAGAITGRMFPREFAEQRDLPQKKAWFPLWLTDRDIRHAYFPELSYCVRADIYQRLIEANPARTAFMAIPDYDPILRFHFEFICQGYLPVYLPELANYSRMHAGQFQMSPFIQSCHSAYDTARAAHVKKLLSGEAVHVWRDGAGREISRLDASQIRRMIWQMKLRRRKIVKMLGIRIPIPVPVPV